MKIAVCDDDKAAREHIVSLIKEQIQGAEIMTFATGEEMLKKRNSFDISFLDVEMREVSGMDVANHIRQEKQGRTKSIIIFVTGYEKYMNSAFDVSAFHYLLKPINEEKFRNVFGRALKELSVAEEQTKRYILVRNSGAQQKVYIKDIYYIESANKKVIIHTKTGILDSYGKMDEFEQMTGSNFYRCHRCYLVNMEKIVSYNADTIKVANGDKLILAQKKYNDFIKQYMKYISSVILFQKLVQLGEEERKRAILENQMVQMQREIEEIQDIYADMRGLRHDMKSHLESIAAAIRKISGKDKEELDNYIEKMGKTVSRLDFAYRTGNPITDIIIHQKKQEAEKQNISFEADFTYPDKQQIDVYYIGIVLNNALENAIEASSKVEGKKSISLRSYIKGNLFFIEVENDFPSEIVFDVRYARDPAEQRRNQQTAERGFRRAGTTYKIR